MPTLIDTEDEEREPISAVQLYRCGILGTAALAAREGMPLVFQKQMVRLLDEMRATYDQEQINDKYRVHLKNDKGRFVPDPLSDYRAVAVP